MWIEEKKDDWIKIFKWNNLSQQTLEKFAKELRWLSELMKTSDNKEN